MNKSNEVTLTQEQYDALVAASTRGTVDKDKKLLANYKTYASNPKQYCGAKSVTTEQLKSFLEEGPINDLDQLMGLIYTNFLNQQLDKIKEIEERIANR